MLKSLKGKFFRKNFYLLLKYMFDRKTTVLSSSTLLPVKTLRILKEIVLNFFTLRALNRSWQYLTVLNETMTYNNGHPCPSMTNNWKLAEAPHQQ